jgi:hypothetical protein
MFTWKCKEEIQKLYTKEKHHKLLGTSLLSDKFKDFKVDNTIFEKAILSKEYSIRNKRDRYLKQQFLRGVQNAIMAN